MAERPDYDATNDIWIEKPDEKDEEVKRRKERYQSVFSSENGQWVLEDMKRHFGFYTANFLPNQKSPVETTIWLEGQRFVVIAVNNLQRKENG